jgi:selenide,water dikinase
LAQRVLEGARTICNEAGIPLAGGHSIDSAEPIFGLSVTGQINTASIKRNNTAKTGDLLFITKPIGVGILSTAQKRGVIAPEQVDDMIHNMTRLNKLGAHLGTMEQVHALTDVTGFGLLGHAIEMADGANLSLHLYYDKIPVVAGAKNYLAQRIVPDATYRNWNSYSTRTAFEKGVNVMEAFNLLPDPQTNGGLLISVNEEGVAALIELLRANGYDQHLEPIGRFVEKEEKTIRVFP